MIKDQLPYLGENDYDDGGYPGVKFDKDFPIQIGIRPNYDEFKKKEYHKMVICAEMLIGLKGLDLLEEISNKKADKILKEVQSIGPIENLLNNGKFWACDEVLKLLDEMEQTTIVGIKAGKIPFVEYDLNGPPGEFEYHCHGLSFLSWMKKNGYQIPKELSFYENENGVLQWGEGGKNSNLSIDVADNLNNLGIEEVVKILKNTDPGKATTEKVIQLLKSNNIFFDYPSMPISDKQEKVRAWKKEGLSNRVIALILDWKGIENKTIKIESVERAIRKMK